ncbi:hypothetical protein [Siminovitchia fordii]|uniref:Ribosomal protein L20 n=1 Tax=Siminovitchia fordii TaxID=254759 RepID=A0ABQ4KA96_9BACI|nr:hypothetical protein [Siminovitchia fordii]GIN21793.1 hypothetical protein J1TS3_29270 [Siminovitchia fordii]
MILKNPRKRQIVSNNYGAVHRRMLFIKLIKFYNRKNVYDAQEAGGLSAVGVTGHRTFIDQVPLA